MLLGYYRVRPNGFLVNLANITKETLEVMVCFTASLSSRHFVNLVATSPQITSHIPVRINKQFFSIFLYFLYTLQLTRIPFLFDRKCIAGKEQKSEAEVETFLLTLRVSILSGITLSFAAINTDSGWVSAQPHTAYEQYFHSWYENSFEQCSVKEHLMTANLHTLCCTALSIFHRTKVATTRTSLASRCERLRYTQSQGPRPGYEWPPSRKDRYSK